jgi:hypothetical protein
MKLYKALPYVIIGVLLIGLVLLVITPAVRKILHIDSSFQSTPRVIEPAIQGTAGTVSSVGNGKIVIENGDQKQEFMLPNTVFVQRVDPKAKDPKNAQISATIGDITAGKRVVFMTKKGSTEILSLLLLN